MNKKNVVLVIAGLLIIVLLYKLFASGESADDMYWRGVSLKDSSPDKAFIWFHNAAEKYLKSANWGNADAQFKLGECYMLDRGVKCGLGNKFVFMRRSEEDRHEEAAKWFTKAAEKGHAGAQCALGLLYMQGLGVKQDKAEAVKWVRKASEKGYVTAQYALGECYSRGEGVAEDKTEAVKWYRKAAEQGDANAQYNLGLCYTRGKGVANDKFEAKKWYSKAATQKHIEAKNAIYLLEIMEKYIKDAEKGDTNAMYELGRCYSERNYFADTGYVEAAKWFTKAAELGHNRAQYELGCLYEEGCGVEKDMNVAKDLKSIASSYQTVLWKKESSSAYTEPAKIPITDDIVLKSMSDTDRARLTRMDAETKKEYLAGKKAALEALSPSRLSSLLKERERTSNKSK